MIRVLFAFVALLILSACADNSAWLNSDRIERTFGNYGVEVLRADKSDRVSSLYSSSGESRTTRTYAVVEFAAERDAALLDEHATIIAGGSIGATFRDAGWQVEKQHIYIGELDVAEATVEISRLMRIDLPDKLAAHVYRLNVSKDGRTVQYATITEIHHPAYLSAVALREIYGEIIFDDSNRDSLHDFIGRLNPAK